MNRHTIVAGLLLLVASTAHGNDFPLRNPEPLGAEPTCAVQVTTARVVLADYGLLKQDFPLLRYLTSDQIDHWLLEHIGYIAKTQADQCEVNERIQISSQQKMVLRPKRYGRGLVFSVPGGLIDGKGFGAKAPHWDGHGTGLATLGEMMREFAFHKMVDEVLKHSKSGFGTIGAYAVIDWGFKYGGLPAGAIIRQAHLRSTASKIGLLPFKTARQIDNVLRTYGVVSGGWANFAYKRDYMNIQGDRANRRILDFGPMKVVSQVPKDWFTATGAPPVQPDPSVRVPTRLWGGPTDHDMLSTECAVLAQRFNIGEASRQDVERYVRSKLAPVRARLRSAAPPKFQNPVGARKLPAHPKR